MKKLIAALVAALILLPTLKAASYSTISETADIDITDVLTPEQSCEVNLPNYLILTSVKITDGTGNEIPESSYTYTIESNRIKFNISGATSHKTVYNSTKHSKFVTYEKVGTTGAGDSFDVNYEYSVDGYAGTLTKYGAARVKSGTYVPEVAKEVTDSRQNEAGSFPENLSYSQDGYSGMINKDGSSFAVNLPAYEKEATYILGDKYFVGYNLRGYNFVSYDDYVVGTMDLSSVVKGFGDYTDYIFETGYTYNVGSKYYLVLTHNGIRFKAKYDKFIDITTPMNSISQYYYYADEDGYGGTLMLDSLPQVSQVQYLTVKYTSVWDTTYYDKVYGVKTSVNDIPTYSTKTLDDVNSTISEMEASIYTRSSGLREVEGFRCSVLHFESPVTYSGKVYKENSGTTYQQNYKGIVTKPAVDTRVFAQNYSGTVYKGEYEPVYSYNVSVDYIALDESGALPTQVQITNKDELQASTYSSSGILQETSGVFKNYSSDAGITVNAIVKPSNPDRYLKAYVILEGTKYPIVWSDGSEVIFAVETLNGSTFIPLSGLASMKNARFDLRVFEFADEACTHKTDENSTSSTVSVDITPPTISHFVNKRLGTVTLTAVDALSGLDSMKYRVNGGAWTDYTGAISVSESCTIEVQVTDKCSNTTSERFNIKLNDTLDRADVNVYVTENFSRICYIINSNQNNTDELPLSELVMQ